MIACTRNAIVDRKLQSEGAEVFVSEHEYSHY